MQVKIWNEKKKKKHGAESRRDKLPVVFPSGIA